MNKQVRAQIWVGQRARPCLIGYTVNPIGSKSLYRVESITDARSKEEYDIENTLSLNGDMDVIIAASDPKMREFSKRELGVDLLAQKTKKKPTKKPIQSTETNDLLDGL